MPGPNSVEHFSIDSKWIRNSQALRLDASFYNPRVARAIEILKKSPFRISTLGDPEITQQIFIPPRFRRIYVDKNHGVPFLQGSHIVQFQPADLKYLSKTAQRNLHKWIIKKGWILVTCSGTIGRIAIAPKEWDGWAASQHILRIIPKPGSPCPPGYLSAFLSSPIGQAQLTAQIYGAVVDELTEAQARSVLVPVPQTKKQCEEVEAINKVALQAIKKWAEASNLATKAIEAVGSLLPEPEALEMAVEEPEKLTVHAPGPKAERLKIEGDWQEAVKKSLAKKKPPGGWPK